MANVASVTKKNQVTRNREAKGNGMHQQGILTLSTSNHSRSTIKPSSLQMKVRTNVCLYVAQIAFKRFAAICIWIYSTAFVVSSAQAIDVSRNIELSTLKQCETLSTQFNGNPDPAVGTCMNVAWSSYPEIRKKARKILNGLVNSYNSQLRNNSPHTLTKVNDPYIAKGSCPFEGCAYGIWTAQESTPVLDRPNGNLVLWDIVKGERVAATTGESHIHPIKGNVVGKTDLARKGEEAFILNYLGEGVSNIWLRGKIVPSTQLLSDCKPQPSCQSAFDFPEDRAPGEWWARVFRWNGQDGWVRVYDNFVIDSLYEKSNSIPDPFDYSAQSMPSGKMFDAPRLLQKTNETGHSTAINGDSIDPTDNIVKYKLSVPAIPANKLNLIHKEQAYGALMDIFGKERGKLDKGDSRFPRDNCYHSSISAASVAAKKNFIKNSINRLAITISEKALGNISTGVDIGDALLKLSSSIGSAYLTENDVRAAMITSIMEESIGYILPNVAATYNKTKAESLSTPIKQLTTRGLQSLLENEGVVWGSMRATNADIEADKAMGLPLVSSNIDWYYSPITHYLSVFIYSKCSDNSEAIYSVEFMLAKSGALGRVAVDDSLTIERLKKK